MVWTIIARQIGILALLVLIGLAACRTRVITSEAKDFLAKLIFYVTLPAMLMTSFSSIDITPRLLANSLQALLLSAFVLLFMLLAGWLTSFMVRFKRNPVNDLHRRGALFCRRQKNAREQECILIVCKQAAVGTAGSARNFSAH